MICDKCSIVLDIDIFKTNFLKEKIISCLNCSQEIDKVYYFYKNILNLKN